jgi:hypothetical protein
MTTIRQHQTTVVQFYKTAEATITIPKGLRVIVAYSQIRGDAYNNTRPSSLQFNGNPNNTYLKYRLKLTIHGKSGKDGYPESYVFIYSRPILFELQQAQIESWLTRIPESINTQQILLNIWEVFLQMKTYIETVN